MIEKKLGSVVRELRLNRKLGLRTLAEQTGFSPAFISQVENGQASPSISSMERIARALGVTLGEFFHATEEPRTSIARASERVGLAFQWSKAHIEALGQVDAERELEGMIVTIQPGGTSGREPASHTHDQLAFLFSGELELTLGDETHIMLCGDSATIRAGVARRWRNISKQPAQVVIVSGC